jgi:hypothetical protein
MNLYADFEAQQAVKNELAKIERNWLLENDKLTAGEKALIEAEYQAKIRALKDETAEHDRKLKEEELSNAYETTQKSIGASSALTNLFFDNKRSQLEKGSREELDLAKKQFKIQKALQLTNAGIDLSKGITSSLAHSPIAIGVVPNPVGIASLAFTLSTGLKSISDIARTQFTGENATASNVQSPSVNLPTATTTTSDATGTNTSGLNGSNVSQVVLVDSDIKAMNEKTAKVEALSKFP